MSTEEQQLNGEVGQDWDEAASDEGVWPPPPNAPDPLAEYDDFLADLVRAPRRKSLWTQAPWSRLRLVRELRRKTGMHLRPCQDVVNSFCDRYAIFPKPQGFRVWGMHLATAVLLGSYFLFGRFSIYLPPHDKTDSGR